MNLTDADPASSPAWTIQSIGTGESFEKIQRLLDQISADARESSMHVFLKRRASLQEIEGIREECAAADWNREGAEAISPAALEEARRLVVNLATDLPAPEAAGEPSGSIGLEWFIRPGFVMIISFDGGGVARYAALLGDKRTASGTEPFSGSMPSRIESTLRRLLSLAK